MCVFLLILRRNNSFLVEQSSPKMFLDIQNYFKHHESILIIDSEILIYVIIVIAIVLEEMHNVKHYTAQPKKKK